MTQKESRVKSYLINIGFKKKMVISLCILGIALTKTGNFTEFYLHYYKRKAVLKN